MVPANKFLYNVIDESIGHYRRYTKKDLKSKISESNFIIQKTYSFNMLGMLGWFMNGNLLKNPKINKGASGIFDKLVPFMIQIEKILKHKIGLSIICYCQKTR